MNAGRPPKGDEDLWPADAAGQEAMASIDLAVAPVDPPPGLWARIEQALGLEEAQATGVEVSRIGEGKWREIAPGVQMKRMWDKKTVLLRCAPGAFIPDHEHPSFEHALVLSGDLISEFGTFHEGDYHGVPAGGTHQAWTTRTGCLVLVQYAA
jgi:anti-sigma factor ChrR (cupin superfamily)